MGYHMREISRGQFGEPSKVREELEEFEDALYQGNPVMAIQELSDVVGAIEGWLDRHHPTVHLEDLVTMARATRRAFLDGTRSPRIGDMTLGQVTTQRSAQDVHPKDRYCQSDGCYYERGHSGRCSDDEAHP